MALGSMDILTLPIHEHGICFHLFVSSSISYNSPSTGLSPWLNSCLGVLLFFGETVNGIVFLISLSDSSGEGPLAEGEYVLNDLLYLIKWGQCGQASLCRASHLFHLISSFSLSPLGSCKVRIVGHN
uniref:Uncharacterized protein n=1 Tax=Rousettus aegyptiacus TaxID=9407 RepID=A0A7J8F0V0_ROUAE|nr:hypothetical protein HJG63_012351 [Rousettus aegyptiacus]